MLHFGRYTTPHLTGPKIAVFAWVLTGNLNGFDGSLKSRCAYSEGIAYPARIDGPFFAGLQGVNVPVPAGATCPVAANGSHALAVLLGEISPPLPFDGFRQ